MLHEFTLQLAIEDSPYYVFVALCIVVIVVSLIFKMVSGVRISVIRPNEKSEAKMAAIDVQLL